MNIWRPSLHSTSVTRNSFATQSFRRFSTHLKILLVSKRFKNSIHDSNSTIDILHRASSNFIRIRRLKLCSTRSAINIFCPLTQNTTPFFWNETLVQKVWHSKGIFNWSYKQFDYRTNRFNRLQVLLNTTPLHLNLNSFHNLKFHWFRRISFRELLIHEYILEWRP